MVSESADEVLNRTVLGRYRIVHKLARGGMGVVYLARTEGAAGFAKPAVVKRILPDLVDDDKMTQMFVREARIMSYLHHPNIVGVLDFGEEDRSYIMVLEYVHGFHLGRWYRYVNASRGAFPAHLAIYIVVKVLEALDYAHTLKRPDGTPFNLVHRDISPSNVLLSTDGHIKLADFGIARVAGETQVFKTEETTVKGKFPYLAPELFTGQPATVQTDLYSCGVVLHELLLGKNEFRGREIAQTIHRVFTHKPTLRFPNRDDIPEELGEVLGKALAKSPHERYRSAREFAQQLRKLQTVPEAVLASNLAQEIQSDFNGEMPGRLGVQPLQELDAAWRNAGPSAGLESADGLFLGRPDARLSTSSSAHSPVPATKASEPPASAVAKQERSSSTLARNAALSLGILILGGLAFVAVKLTQRGEDAGAPPKVIVVKQEQTGSSEAVAEVPSSASHRASAATDTEASLGNAPGAEPDTIDEETEKKSTRAAPKSARLRQSRSQSLSATFAKRSPEVRACFDKHATSISGAPSIGIRFAVDKSGRVTKAQISPTFIEKTALGNCIANVALGTRFGPQQEPIQFRIPLRMQMVPSS